jgi:hypothetical protein
MEDKIKMISAATQVLTFRKSNPLAIDEEIFQHVTDYIAQEGIRDEKTRRAMIATASRTFKLSRECPNLSEKEILKKVMEDIPEILTNIEDED